jgi:UDP-2,3-diacylglucosamine pyrophosphatase LpxH
MYPNAMAERPLLVFISDIHLTDSLHNVSVPRADTFERFWTRIQAARGTRPAELCFVGDLLDIVRSPSWFDAGMRPYDDPSPRLAAHIDAITKNVVEREAGFFTAIRKRVESGELSVSYVLGNHDRLLRFAPAARARLWKALTGKDETPHFPDELHFPEHKVLAYHGHRTDAVNFHPEAAGTIGDAIGCDLIVGFPRTVRAVTGQSHPELDDIDDVRPIYAVPAWVRHFGMFHPDLLSTVQRTWTDLVDGFLSGGFVNQWLKDTHRPFRLDTALKLKILFGLSTKRIVAKGSDRRLTELYKVMQHSFDGKMAGQACAQLEKRSHVQYVVNGHSHFANMKPLGNHNGKPAVYFNTGTWRSVHQIGHGIGGRPTFLPYDAMSYLVFFPSGDSLGRDYEWWTGAMVAAPKAVRHR